MTDDFPDWISPMLVKELRQGMRSRVFLISFLALQLAMIFLAIIGLLDWQDQNASSGVTVFFWIIVGLPLLFIMPLSGLNSISGEQKAGTLELIFLSRLRARRIVLGKWLAIVAQTVLLVCAILPYVVLRYYVGGVDLTQNLETLGWLFLGSMVLTACMVALSPSAGRIGRALLPVAFIIGTQFLGIFASFSVFGISGSVSAVGASAAATTAGWLLLSLLVFLFMLEMGAGKIAPAAENHSTSKRLVACAVLLLSTGYSLLFPGITWIWTAGLYIITPICIGAVCEPVREIVRIYRPFSRLGWAGRVLGLFFYPGWASGVLFSGVVLALLFLLPHAPFARVLGMSGLPRGAHVRYFSASGHMVRAGAIPAAAHMAGLWPLLIVVGIVGTFFLPAAVVRLVRLRSVPPVMVFVLFELACALLTLLATSTSSKTDAGLEYVVALIPFCSLLLAAQTGSWPPSSISAALIGGAILTAISLLILFVKMIPCWKLIFALEKKAAAQNAADAVRPDVLPSSEPA